MRDLEQAADLDIDTSHMVVVTHPDKQSRFGGAPAEFTMTERAFAKRGLKGRGFKIKGRAVPSDDPRSQREEDLEAEVARLQAQLAAMEDKATDRDALEAEAAELGIKVHPNTKDETLERKIAEARAASVNADEDFD